MAKTKTTTPLYPQLQIYFGEKAIHIEKNPKKILQNDVLLKQAYTTLHGQATALLEQREALWDENITLKEQVKNLTTELSKEKIERGTEKTKLESQVKIAEANRDKAWKQLDNSHKFTNKIWVYLGNYGTNPPLYSLDQLKWLLRKHDKPTTDNDYYTLFDLRTIVLKKEQYEQLSQFLASQKVANLDELDKKIKKLWDDITQGQNKSKQLEIQITNKDNEIFQQTKTIQTLQLKNEKLTNNYKNLIQHLANARQLVSHLQKDLQTEKQDKNHIQQELGQVKDKLVQTENDLKPFLETGLTAEQIKQMEQDLEYQRKLLYQGAMEIDKLEKGLSEIEQKKVKKEQEIISLQTKVKDLTPNLTEKRLLLTIGTVNSEEILKTDLSILKETKIFFETGKSSNQEADWSKLRKDYKNIKSCIIQILELVIKEKELEEQMEQKNKELAGKNKDLSDLQTKYDMEVRSKEELSKLLNIYRRQKSVDLRELDYNETNESKIKDYVELINQSISIDFVLISGGKLPFIFPKDKLNDSLIYVHNDNFTKESIIEVKRGDKFWKQKPNPSNLVVRYHDFYLGDTEDKNTKIVYFSSYFSHMGLSSTPVNDVKIEVID